MVINLQNVRYSLTNPQITHPSGYEVSFRYLLTFFIFLIVKMVAYQKGGFV